MSLSEEDRLNLKSMVKKSYVENTTEKIRNLKQWFDKLLAMKVPCLTVR